ncbi:NTE family protein [Desulfosalsimonas propionicica]|uniref:NTE family protein n=1 Tax=Desulfosalsimonas propionicica TaxID=332175 RepID=A0A7W0C951_9BACT|nr:patatin-like phospholipase family protein [Desulfosalsimonas propionicica]MBA2881459.1 NTE family protein [Desulfosalsimonas propionicica]
MKTEKINNGKTAFVFAGGGSLGAIQVGMLKAIIRTGIIPDFLVGALVGALNAVFFAFDPTPDGVSRLEKIWLGIKRKDVFPLPPIRKFFGLVQSQKHICSPKPLTQLIRTSLPGEYLEDCALPCMVIATSLFHGHEVTLTKGSVLDALLASTAIPGILPQVKFEELYLIDGSVTNNTPISTAIMNGASRIFVFPTGICCARKAPPKGLVEMILQAMSIAISHRLAMDIEKFRQEVEIRSLPTLCPLDASMFNFSRTAELISRAEQKVSEWLDSGGLNSDSDLKALQPHYH